MVWTKTCRILGPCGALGLSQDCGTNGRGYIRRTIAAAGSTHFTGCHFFNERRVAPIGGRGRGTIDTNSDN
jgi:hypothetical protein